MPYKKSTQRDYGDSPLDASTNGGYSPYKMKGHTLPGINQRSEGNTDLADGRSGSSPLQHPHDTKVTHGSSGHNTRSGLSVEMGGKPNADNPNFAAWKKGHDVKAAEETTE